MDKREYILCIICNKPFLAKQSYIKTGRAYCCSIKCRSKRQTGKGNSRWIDGRSFKPKLGVAKGERHWNWQGGKTDIISTIRTMPENIKWRKDIFERDNYTCQTCQKKGGYLQADHIDPLSFIVEREGINSREDARKSKALWDLNNGRTLCLKCHHKTKTFGINLVYLKKKYEKK